MWKALMLKKVMQWMCFHVWTLRHCIVNVKSGQSQQRSFKYSTVAKSACLIVNDGHEHGQTKLRHDRHTWAVNGRVYLYIMQAVFWQVEQLLMSWPVLYEQRLKKQESLKTCTYTHTHTHALSMWCRLTEHWIRGLFHPI